MTPPAIFDRAARRLRRDRIARYPPGPADRYITDLIAERLDAVTRRFETALVINGGAGPAVEMLRARGIAVSSTDIGERFATALRGPRCDEDRLVLPSPGFDMVLAFWGFDTIDDLPGALILARRALRPDGLFLGVVPAAPSLPILRRAIAAAEATSSRATARLHPQIDVRAAGDLLVRAGFALPVADIETVRLAYRDIGALFADLHRAGGRNVLADRHAVSRRWLADVAKYFAAEADESGRTIETVSLAVLTGWAAAPSQPRPAARGSATASLARTLGKRG